MDYSNIILIIIGLCLVTVCFLLFRKSGRFFSALFLSLVSGIGGLIAVNLLSFLTDVSIPVNPITVIYSSLTGLSGVISLILWQIFL